MWTYAYVDDATCAIFCMRLTTMCVHYCCYHRFSSWTELHVASDLEFLLTILPDASP